MKKIFIPLYFFTLFIGLTAYAHAAQVTYVVAPAAPAVQQEFSIDVLFDPQGDTYNAIEGTVSFSDTLTLVRIEDGDSTISHWIDAPAVHANTIAFSGIMPGGFDGRIDPFTPSIRTPGKIMRLVFLSANDSDAAITTQALRAARGDGTGTVTTLSSAKTVIHFSNVENPIPLTTEDTVLPALEANVVTDRNLFDGKRTLIFNATDKETGVARVEISENGEAFHVVTSPYLLHVQSRNAPVLVRAIDNAGNVAQVTIPAETPPRADTFFLVMACIATLVFLWWILEKNKPRLANEAPPQDSKNF